MNHMKWSLSPCVEQCSVFNPFWHICELQLKLERAGKRAIWERMGVNVWSLYHWHQQTPGLSRAGRKRRFTAAYCMIMITSDLCEGQQTQTTHVNTSHKYQSKRMTTNFTLCDYLKPPKADFQWMHEGAWRCLAA